MGFIPEADGMRMRRWLKRSEKGQATLEFMIVFPLLFGLFLLALAIAAVWHGHHLSSAISLEGASRESIQSGWGSSFVFATGNNVSDNTSFSVEIADFEQTRSFPPAKRFTVHGTVGVPWAPFGLNWNVPVQGTTFYPVWEFYGR
jgi:hypothetical protein